ncbi:hypothetical protein Tco_0578251 [Tanacetum coccineum]
MVKKWTTPDAVTEGEWGFEHTKAVFLNEFIPFLKTLKDIFDVFDKDLLNEVTEVETVFNQMEAVVQQCSDILLTIMNSTIVYGDYVNLEMQKYFGNNNLKAQLLAKDTTIRKLKEHIKSMRENDKKEKVKQDMDEIETINIESEHSVAKLLFENKLLQKEIEHLKQIYKDQFDSIKKTRAYSKEHSNSLIAQLNSKSMENVDLKRKLFTLVGNSCPLTRITSTKVEPIKETTSHSVKTQNPEIKVYSRRPKQVKSVGSSKKAKIVESRIANNSKPNHSWGSNATDVPSSSSLVNDRLSRFVLCYVDFGCSKHMTGNRSQLMN